MSVDLSAIRARAQTPKPWPENATPTAEQLAAWLKACTDEERVEVAAKMLRASDEASQCFIRNHKASETGYPQALQRVSDLELHCVELITQRDLARDVAANLEAELARNGICGHLAPTLAGGTALPVCELRAGHDGWHEADDGCKWSESAVGLAQREQT